MPRTDGKMEVAMRRDQAMAVTTTGQRPPAAMRAGLLLCLAASLLAGCAAKPQAIYSGTLVERAPAERAFIDMPPGGPAILGVIQRTYSNATTQEITLENRASVVNENKFWVTMLGPVLQTTAPDNKYWPDQMSTLNVGREFGWYLPGIKMHVSNYYTQNKYGPFGYAIGSRGVDTCIYAWQRIASDNTNGNWFSRQGAIILRLRYCAPHTSETALLTLMTSFTINSYFLSGRWNPYGSAPPPNDAIGKPGVAILPVTAATTTPAITSPVLGPVGTLAAPSTVTSTVRRSSRRAVAPANATNYVPPVDVIQPGAATVPLDTGVTAADLAGATTAGAASAAATSAVGGAPVDGYPAVPSP